MKMVCEPHRALLNRLLNYSTISTNYYTQSIRSNKSIYQGIPQEQIQYQNDKQLNYVFNPPKLTIISEIAPLQPNQIKQYSIQSQEETRHQKINNTVLSELENILNENSEKQELARKIFEAKQELEQLTIEQS